MPDLRFNARYETDEPLEVREVAVAPVTDDAEIQYTTPVRWVWRVAWFSRAQYEEMRLDRPKEEVQDLVAEALDRLYLDLDRAQPSFMGRACRSLPIRGTGTDSPTVLEHWPTPIEMREVGPGEESIMFAQRAFSLN